MPSNPSHFPPGDLAVTAAFLAALVVMMQVVMDNEKGKGYGR